MAKKYKVKLTKKEIALVTMKDAIFDELENNHKLIKSYEETIEDYKKVMVLNKELLQELKAYINELRSEKIEKIPDTFTTLDRGKLSYSKKPKSKV